MRVVPVVTHLTTGRLVPADVLITEEAVVGHAATVTRLHGIGDPPPEDGANDGHDDARQWFRTVFATLLVAAAAEGE